MSPLHILGGNAKGRLIRVPPNIRPTLARVRKSIFDILKERIVGTKVLDLYSGSGALGLEALSRGAESVTFVEKGRLQVNAILFNLDQLGFKERAEVLRGDVFVWLKRLKRQNRRFSIVFLAPPFLANYCTQTLECLYDLLQDNAVVIIEHHKKELVSLHSYKLVKRCRMGDTMVSILCAV